MSRRATRSPQARRDLVNIAVEIGLHNEDASERFLRAAADAVLKLVDFPGMGALYEVRDPKLAGLRFWPITGFRNYLIWYRPTRRGVRVLRVLHGAQDRRRIFGR
jgi:toxin ParE1/3/4